MTEADMHARLQSAQDALDIISKQREAFLDEIVKLGVTLARVQRENGQLKARVAELEAAPKRVKRPT